MIDVRVPYFIKRPLCRRPPSIVEVRLPKIPKCSHILWTRRGEEVAPASERARASRRLGPKLADPPSDPRSVRVRPRPPRHLRRARAHFAQVQNFTLAIDDGGGDAMAWADLRSERNGRRAGGGTKPLGTNCKITRHSLSVSFPTSLSIPAASPFLFSASSPSSLLLLSSRFSSLSSSSHSARSSRLPVICHFHSVLMVANRLVRGCAAAASM